jgi:hypothetical protein
MSKQTINLGTAPTGAGGDTPRSAFTKMQANFDEVYVALGGTTIPASLPLTKGGTGGTDAATARTGLGLGTVAVESTVPLTKGGTGGTTAAAARTNLGLKSAAVADILGTVSHFFGVPTGSILEAGTNANGDYVRFADGTQICVKSGTTGALNLTTVVGPCFNNNADFLNAAAFPIAFSVAPKVTHSYRQSAWYGFAQITTLPTTANWPGLRAFSIGSSPSTTINYDLIAVGRWF